MGCEPALVVGRPCDFPGCAVSANPKVSFCPAVPARGREERAMGRCIGMDIHRDFAQVAVVENGLLRDEGRVDCRPQQLREWAQTLRPDDQIALEATAK